MKLDYISLDTAKQKRSTDSKEKDPDNCWTQLSGARLWIWLKEDLFEVIRTEKGICSFSSRNMTE